MWTTKYELAMVRFLILIVTFAILFEGYYFSKHRFVEKLEAESYYENNVIWASELQKELNAHFDAEIPVGFIMYHKELTSIEQWDQFMKDSKINSHQNYWDWVIVVEEKDIDFVLNLMEIENGYKQSTRTR